MLLMNFMNRIRNQTHRLAALLLTVALVAAACGNDDDGNESSPSAELKVGYLLALDERFSRIVTPMVNAIELARDEINAAGGNVVLVPGNSGHDAAIANETADSLIADGVSAIVGAESSQISLGVIDKITRAEVVMISPINSAPVFTQYDDGGYYFRTLPSDALQAIEMADLMKEAGVTNAGILHLDNAYGLGFARALEDRLVEDGVRVGLKVPYNPPGTDFNAEIDLEADIHLLRDARVDGVAIVAFNQTATIVSHKLEVGMDPGRVPFFISAAVSGGDWRDTDPDDPSVLDGTKVIFTSETPEAGETTFASRYEAYAGEEAGLYSSYAYDAVVILALASLAADSTDPADIAEGINAVTRDGTKCSLYAACAALIADGEDIDYDGASGILDFTRAGEPSTGGYDIYEFNEQGTLDFVSHEVVHVDEL